MCRNLLSSISKFDGERYGSEDGGALFRFWTCASMPLLLNPAKEDGWAE